MSFSTRMRERREMLGLKQSELGRLLGVTGSAVANYESGFSSPKVEVLFKAFDALQCDANYLFQDEMTTVMPSDDSAVLRAETSQEELLLNTYRSLNAEGQEKLLEYADDLSASGKYIKIDMPNMGQGS